MVNNTLLKKYDRRVLNDGDVIKFGNTTYMFKLNSIPPDDQGITDEALSDITDMVIAAVEEVVTHETNEEKPEAAPEVVINCASTSNNEIMSQGDKKNPEETVLRMSVEEDELTCSICSELFYKAVTLGCSHTFCQYCIGMWRKNSQLCPICRTKIKDLFPTLIVNNFVEKVSCFK